MNVKKVLYILKYIFSILLITAVVFCFIPDQIKAKLVVSVLGFHETNDSPGFEILESKLLNDNYRNCQSRNEIPLEVSRLIEEYYNFGIDTTLNKYQRIKDIFASGNDDWSAGCIVNGELPSRKFVSVHYSNESIISIYLSGGLGVATYLDLYEIKNERLEKVLVINTIDAKLFNLALMLKFQKNVTDYMNIEEENKFQLPD